MPFVDWLADSSSLMTYLNKIAIVVTLGLIIRWFRSDDESVEPEVQDRERAATQLFVSGAIFGAGLTAFGYARDPFGPAVVFTNSLLGLVISIAACGTELHPVGENAQRQPILRSYRIGRLVPGPLSGAVVLVALTLVGSASAAILTATPDKAGQPGRVLTGQCGTLGGTEVAYPGSFYSVPLVAFAVVGAIVAILALRAIATRRQLGSSPETDFESRRRSGRRVISGLGIALSIAMMGISTVGSDAINVLGCGSVTLLTLEEVWNFTLPAATFVLLWSAGSLVVSLGRTTKPFPADDIGTRSA